MYYARFGQLSPASTALSRLDPLRVPTRVEQPAARAPFPFGTPLGIVALSTADCDMLRAQGIQCGLRMRALPDRTSAIVHAGVPQGSFVAVRSGEQVDSEGRAWRLVDTISGVRGWMPFVGPNGVPNVAMANGSPPWPENRATPLPVTPRTPDVRVLRFRPGEIVECRSRSPDSACWLSFGALEANALGVFGAPVRTGRRFTVVTTLPYPPPASGIYRGEHWVPVALGERLQGIPGTETAWISSSDLQRLV